MQQNHSSSVPGEAASGEGVLCAGRMDLRDQEAKKAPLRARRFFANQMLRDQ
jgi:hypothetical protein